MLNFRSASILMIILAVLVILLMIFRPHLWWILLPLTAIYLLMLIAGSIYISSNFYLRALCRGKKSEKVLAVTFDDGPDEIITLKVLAILEKYNIPATFFIIGKKAEKQVDMIQQIITKGHLIGLHSYGHAFFFDLYRRGKMEQDLLMAEEIMMKATGKKPLLFRPPYGVTNPILAKVLKKLGYNVIGWSVRSMDTTINDAGRVARRIIARIHPGAIIQMHDTRGITPEVLEKVIITAKDEGYRFAGLDEVLDVEAYKN